MTKFRKFQQTDKSRWWFTSDLHLGHANILKFCDRPFSDIEEMNKVLIDNLNSRVRKADHLVIAGDFCFGKRPKIFLDQIVCENIHFVLGSHDVKLNYATSLKLCDLDKELHIEIDGQTIVVSHCPHLTWERSHYGSWNLFGHLHTKVHQFLVPDEWETSPYWSRIVDVLVDGRHHQVVRPPITDIDRIISTAKMLDIGVDGHEYMPWCFEEIKVVMDVKPGYLLQKPQGGTN